MKGLLLPLVLLCFTAKANAEVSPHPGIGDAHVQSVDYDPEQVVDLRVALGFAVTIEFSSDERIENVSLGNSAVWQAVPNRRADLLFVKPMQGATLTNLTVVTDARWYHFNLEPAFGPEPNLPYAVHFTYKSLPVAIAETVKPQSTRYIFQGSHKLRPTKMSDDGTFTSIIWGPDVTMPAVFTVDADGKEALVNGAVRDGAYMIEGIAVRFHFRRGALDAYALRKIVKPRR